jgi:RecB family exonuclease
VDVRVWPSEEALEEALAEELAPGAACVLGTADLTWRALVEMAAAPGPALDEVTARLALRVACTRAGLPANRGVLAAAARYLAEVERAGAPARELAPEVAALGHVHREWAALAARIGPSLDARRAHPSPPPLGSVDIMPRLDWQPADVELVLALARRGPVRVHLPWGAGRPEVFGGLEPVLAAFERRGADHDLELVLEEPVARAPITLLDAPHPLAELRAVAAHVRALVDAGAAPETIAVCVRAPGPHSRRLAAELDRVGLRLDDRRGPPLASAAPARLALALLELCERGFAREEVLAVLGSRYVAAAVPAHRVARAARRLGVRALDLDGVARLPPAEAAAARALVAPLAALPATAPVGVYAGALRRVLDGLGVGRRARAFDPDLADGGAAARGLERALAQDQAAALALERLFDRLPAAARAADLEAPVTRREAAAILADVMAELPLRARGVRGGAVRLLGLPDLAARRFDHVILLDLVEGVAPARASEDGLYGERHRRAVNQALGRWAVPTGAGDLRTPYETLMLEVTVAAARHSVLLATTRTLDDRPVARSPFVDAVLAAHPGVPIVPVPLSALPPLGRAVAPADVLARTALEIWGDAEGRLPPRPAHPAAPAWLAALRRELPARASRVEALAQVEQARWRFFAGTEPAGRFAGATGRPVDRATPIPARQLELLANCGFTFLAGRLLGVEPADEADDAPSARTAGQLAHRCLERYYRRRPTAPDRAALDAACAEAFAEAEAEGIPGHAGLWRLARARLADELWAVVALEPPWGGRPAHVELAFGGRGGLPALAVGGLLVSGRVDRVDETADGFVVVDYKLGGKAAQTAKIRDAATTQLQLPIYAAAMRAGLGRPADAAFISLREAAATRTLGDAHDLDALLGSALPTRVAELAGQLAAGAFPAAPHDCRGCAFRTVCRVVHTTEEDDA